MPETIYMPLEDEGVDVWAPISAERLDADRYRVLGPMPDDQIWRWSPGKVVVVAERTFDQGVRHLTAVGVAAG